MTRKKWNRPFLRILSINATKSAGGNGDDGGALGSSGNTTS
jgi:hypothetical protein